MSSSSPLFVDCVGKGRDVVLLHGLPSPPEDLTTLASGLPGCRILVPHLPGYGRTPPLPGQQNAAAVTELLVATLAEHGVRTPLLVGFSMGGYRALMLAERIAARGVLVLAGFADLSPEERAGMKGFADALRAGVDVKPLLPPRFLSPEHRRTHPEDDLRVAAWAECTSSSVLIEELDDCVVMPSAVPSLGALSCPVLARAGELDAAVPPSHAEAIARAAKHGRAEIVPGAGHSLYMEDRAGTLAALKLASSGD